MGTEIRLLLGACTICNVRNAIGDKALHYNRQDSKAKQTNRFVVKKIKAN